MEWNIRRSKRRPSARLTSKARLIDSLIIITAVSDFSAIFRQLAEFVLVTLLWQRHVPLTHFARLLARPCDVQSDTFPWLWLYQSPRLNVAFRQCRAIPRK